MTITDTYDSKGGKFNADLVVKSDMDLIVKKGNLAGAEVILIPANVDSLVYTPDVRFCEVLWKDETGIMKMA